MVTKAGAMSFSQFGYPYNAASQFLVSASPGAACCDSVSRSVPECPAGSQAAAAFCCPPYSRTELGAALGVYGAPYGGQSYANYFPYGAEPAAHLYTSLTPQYEIKDSAGNLHSGISQSTTYYPYEPSLGQYQYDRYGTVDFNGSSRRKNATRETTSTLKTWLYEHRKNPYPTKGEKIMLAIITKMTLTQVSTWFANARRRLKKENKMTWSPKNKTGEDRKDDLEKSEQDCVSKESKECKEDKGLHLSDLEDMEDEDCDKLDEDCEKDTHEEQNLSEELPKRNCSSMVSCPSFSCGTKTDVALLAPDFPGPGVTKTSVSTVASHFDTSGKSLIWSPARSADSVLGSHPNGECQLQAARRFGAPRGLTDTLNLPAATDAVYHETPHTNSKSYSTATFSHKSFQLHCPSYSILPETCQYLPGEGFSSSRKSGSGSEIGDVCLTLPDDKVTAFRPVMKR